MEKQHEKHIEKYGWVEEKSTEAAKMLIEATKKDENGVFVMLFFNIAGSNNLNRSFSCVTNMELYRAQPAHVRA